MTICIGVLCCDGKAAIAASDRMVTWGQITEFEHEVPKITALCQKIVTLTAGDALRGSRLAHEVKRQIPGASPEVREVTDTLSQKYVEQRKSQLESEIFLPRGFGMSDFYQGGLQQRMIGPLAGGIDEQVASYDFGVHLLVVGCDDGGAHLFSLRNPGGSYDDHNQIGFHAIGSGSLHALQSLIGFGHTSARPLPESLFAVYASKKRAEVAPGVGHDTDIVLIDSTGMTWLQKSVLESLEKIYQDYEKPLTPEMKEKVAKLDLKRPKKEGEGHDKKQDPQQG